jgi:hypothetical protein
MKNRYNDSLRQIERWRRFDNSLTSQYVLRNHCNDYLNHHTVHQIVITLHRMLATLGPFSNKSTCIKDRCNDSLNRWNDFLKRWMIYKALLMIWLPIDQFSDRFDIFWKRYNDLWKRYNDSLKCCNGLLNRYTILRMWMINKVIIYFDWLIDEV